MKIKLFQPETPFISRQETSRATISGSADYYGACSLEKFKTASALTYTHEDAQGFLDYVTQFKPANFWLKDADVRAWWYQRGDFPSFLTNFDNFQDTYGADAVLAFYHSGHGNMDSNGVFTASMGETYIGFPDVCASNKMSLGDSQVRYLFWSTCYSLRISGSHNPRRTWADPNNGVRMIFGYETTSVDDPNYGKYFWEEWNKNKSFKSAFLDASWRISHNQTPVVAACGATQTEANSRLQNERSFQWGSVSDNWYAWAWYNAVSPESGRRSLASDRIPNELMISEFTPIDSVAQIQQMADKLEFSTRLGANLDDRGNYSLGTKKRKLHIGRDGRVDAILANPNYRNKKQLQQNQASDIANQFIQDRGLQEGVDLELARICQEYRGGGTTKGSGRLLKPYVSETTLEYRQVINGIPVINNDAGVLRVRVDNDGKVTSLHNSTRPVASLTNRPKVTISAVLGQESRSRSLTESNDLETAFASELNRILGRSNGSSRSLRASGDEIVSTDIGYDVRDAYGRIVAHRTYKVDMGGGFEKMYKVEVPIFE